MLIDPYIIWANHYIQMIVYMKERMCLSALFSVITACLLLTACAQAPNAASNSAPSSAPIPAVIKEIKTMSNTPYTARGTFEVKLVPQPLHHADADKQQARMSIDKQFSGELQAVSQGEMLSAMTAVKGSAGYVAIERVTGTLHGKSGSFVLQHTGVMNRGAPQLTVNVVPDSGTGQLVGLKGSMTIDIKDGTHFYAFAYSMSP
jgi:Protein of unknown function (DUF3224)